MESRHCEAQLGHEDAKRAAYLLRSHVLTRLGEAVARAGVDALLVKGAALAHTVYAKPWHREMSDVDVLVRPGQRKCLIEVLEGAGCLRMPPAAGRIWSEAAFGETQLLWHRGAVVVLIEVHDFLDKLVSRPVDYEGIFARASRHAELPGFLLPSAEDHVLLVALHAAASEFTHPVAFLDLELLFRGDLDLEVLDQRARAWRLETAFYVCLAALRAQGAPSLPAEMVQPLAPGALRRFAVRRCYDIDAYPPAQTPPRLGLPWVLRQTVLRDDLAAWLLGVGRYGAQRAAERFLGAIRERFPPTLC